MLISSPTYVTGIVHMQEVMTSAKLNTAGAFSLVLTLDVKFVNAFNESTECFNTHHRNTPNYAAVRLLKVQCGAKLALRN
jgi:hypothetical protein